MILVVDESIASLVVATVIMRVLFVLLLLLLLLLLLFVVVVELLLMWLLLLLEIVVLVLKADMTICSILSAGTFCYTSDYIFHKEDQLTNLVSFDEVGNHDDSIDIFQPDHPPHVFHGLRCRALRGDVGMVTRFAALYTNK